MKSKYWEIGNFLNLVVVILYHETSIPCVFDFFLSAEHVGKINRTILHCKEVTTSISFLFGFKTLKVFPLVSCFCLLVSMAEINKNLQFINKLIIWHYFGSF